MREGKQEATKDVFLVQSLSKDLSNLYRCLKIISRTSIARTSLEPCNFVSDIGSSNTEG